MTRTFSRLGIATSAACAGLACALAEGLAHAEPPPDALHLPVDVSRDGHLIDAAIHYTTYCIVVLFTLMASVLIYTMIFHREGVAKADYDHGRGKKPVMLTALVLGLTFVVVD